MKKLFKSENAQLLVPVIALLAILIFDLIAIPDFFKITVGKNNNGNPVLQGYLINVLNGASELAVLAMGMTLVTAACGGQDISVGALAAIAGSVFVKVLRSFPAITGWTVVLGFVAALIVAMLFGAFNGTLVAVFKIQPMIATLILFTCGRSVAYWINGGATPTIDSPIITAIGGYIPGCPIPTPVIIVVVCALLFSLLFKVSTLRLYIQSVGVNKGAAYLNGINPVFIQILSFIILGACCSVAGTIAVSRLSLINHETLLVEIEMDAILAVAIGGNLLGGGKFKMLGSVLGAYAIQLLTITLYAMKVPSTDVKAYKAVVIILLVVLGSSVIKEGISKAFKKLQSARSSSAKEAN